MIDSGSGSEKSMVLVVVSVIAFVISGVFFVSGCGNIPRPPKIEDKPVNVVTKIGYSNALQTADYEGHKFIVVSSSSSSGGANIIHHPSCPCLK